MISEDDFHGGARYHELTGDLVLGSRGKRLHGIVATVPGLAVKLPDARRLSLGGPIFYLANLGSESFDIVDQGENVLTTILENRFATLCLMSKLTANGQWSVSVTELIGGPQMGLVTASGRMLIQTMFMGKGTLGTGKTASGTMLIETAFSGSVRDPMIKEASGRMLISTAFSGAAAVFPTVNIVSPSATGSGTGTLASPWTLKQAAAALAPGDTAHLRGGTYPNSLNHVIDSQNATVNSGSSAGGHITFEAYPGEVPVITGPCRIDARHHLTFRGIKFFSKKSSWVAAFNGLGHEYFTFENCVFDCDPPDLSGPYSGLDMRGVNHIIMRGCYVIRWPTGDAIGFRYCSDILVENCDMSQARCGHTVAGFLDCPRVRMRSCFFRNPIDRCFTARRDTQAERVLVEDCVFADSDWDGKEPHPLDGTSEENQRGANDVLRFSVRRSVLRNCIFVGSRGGKYVNPAVGDQTHFLSSTCLQISYATDFKDISDVRMYNCVVHRNILNDFAVTYNTSAGAIVSNNNKFKNMIFTKPGSYSIAIFDKNNQIKWGTWLFEKCMISDPTKTKLIYIATAPKSSMTVAEAESGHGSVFKNNITSAPAFTDEAILDRLRAAPKTFSLRDLQAFFDAFTEVPGSAGVGAGTKLASVTAGGTGDTIAVDDAWWFMGPDDFYPGDRILIGSNAPVEILEIISQTSIRVNASITVSNGDEIYLERMGTNPSIGLMPLEVREEKETQGSMVIATAFTGRLSFAQLTARGTMSIATAFTGKLAGAENLFEITHEVGNSSEYNTFVSGGGDLAVTAGSALDGTTRGLRVLINDTGSIYGQKVFTWITDYLRLRFYVDPNGLVMGVNESFELVEWQTSSGFNVGNVQISEGSPYYLTVVQRKDDTNFAKTGSYAITDAPHYVEVEVKRASSAVANDGHLKLWIDGVLKETVSGLDIFDAGRPTRLNVGAARGIDSGTNGTLYLDEIVLREESVEIGP